MSVKTKKETSTKTKITVASVVRRILGLKKTPTDEKFIVLVKKETGSKKFDQKQLSWYRSQFKSGRLSKGRKAASSN